MTLLPGQRRDQNWRKVVTGKDEIRRCVESVH